MSGIRKIILGGFFWTITNQLSTTLVTLAVSAVLSRLITPGEFGILGMVSLATGFLNIIKDFGLGAALVQKKSVTDEEYSTVFWINVILGFILAAITFLSAPVLVSFFKEPQVEHVARVLSFTFLINAVGIVWNNRLVKDVAFRKIFYRSFVSVIISGVVGIIFAFYGFGIWALVIQTYVALIVNTFLNYLAVKWLPQAVIKKEYIRELMRFSIPLLAEQSINYWVRNLDNLLVGNKLGKESLGFYNRAYTLMLLPVKQLSGTLTKVLFPSFSLIQDDKARIAAIYLKISRVIALIAFPMMIGLSILSEQVILILYGDQWKPVIPIFRVLSLLGMFQAIGTLTANVYLAQGKTRLLFYVGLYTKGCMITGIVVGLYTGGLMGMVYGYCLGSLLAFFPDLYFVGYVLGISLWRIVRNFLPYLSLGLVMGGAVYGVSSLYPFDSQVVTMIVYSLMGIFIYSGLAWVFKIEALTDLLELVKNRKKS